MSIAPEKQPDVEKALEEALAERNRLWAQLNEARVDQRELERLREELKAIHASTTWRVLGRYQRIRRLLRIGLKRLRES